MSNLNALTVAEATAILKETLKFDDADRQSSADHKVCKSFEEFLEAALHPDTDDVHVNGSFEGQDVIFYADYVGGWTFRTVTPDPQTSRGQDVIFFYDYVGGWTFRTDTPDPQTSRVMYALYVVLGQHDLG